MFPKTVLDIPKENTSIWSCSSDSCSGWMRVNFAFLNNPACPLCSSTMVNDMRILPILANNNKKVLS